MLIYNQSEFSRLILTAHSEHYLVVTKKMMMTVSTSTMTVMTISMMRMVEERCEEGRVGSFDQQLMLSLMLQLMPMITIIIGLMMMRMMHAHSNGDGGSMDHPSASFQMNHLDNGHFAK